jgi:hypothetical protein
MPLPFDATVKDLAKDDPLDFLSAFDTPSADPVTLLNVDLSTITTSADLVFGIGHPLREVVHLDSQSGADEGLHRDVYVYNALLHRLYRVPVHSIVLLLRRQAQHPNLNGTVRYEPRPGRGKTDFSYEIIRMWERPVEVLLGGGLGTLPLAVLGQLPAGVTLEEGLAQVIQRLAERLQREATEPRAKKLWTAAFVLTGLRVPRVTARELFRGVTIMHDSDTYQAILDEGRADALHHLVLRQGGRRFGEPDKTTQTALKAIEDPERLQRLADRIGEVTNWQELLQTP